MVTWDRSSEEVLSRKTTGDQPDRMLSADNMPLPFGVSLIIATAPTPKRSAA